MAVRPRPPRPSARPQVSPAFDVLAYLATTGAARTVTKFRRGAVVYSQGDPASMICYIQNGAVKLSVLSRTGKEAVVAMLGPGNFFGEGALAGQPVRMASATTEAPCTILAIDLATMRSLLHDEHAFSDRFIAHMLTRNLRIEADLVDQLFNSSEKRLARTLLLMAHYGQPHAPKTLPKVSQETLAEMIGTTRSRVNQFMNKFRDLGLIEYNGDIKVNGALLSVVLHD